MLRYVIPTMAFLATAVLPAAEAPRPVTVVTAEEGPVLTRAGFTGSVTSPRRSRLSPRAAGLIATLKVDAGDRVKKGDVLMELDPALGELALARIRAEVEQAKIELEDADRLVREVRDLAKRGGFPMSEAESRETAVRVKAAQVQQLEAMEKEQQELIARHRLVAPFDGVIATKLAEEGEWVQTATPVLELVEMDRLRFDARVPQELFARIRSGMDASVELDALGGRAISAQVASIVPVKDAGTRNFLVRIAWENKGDAAPGMSGRAVFDLQGEKPAVQVPRDAVVRFPDGSARVWEVEGTGDALTARPRVVTLGDSLADKIQVLTGLEAGVRVIVRGNEGLEEGQAVKVLAETGEEGGR